MNAVLLIVLMVGSLVLALVGNYKIKKTNPEKGKKVTIVGLIAVLVFSIAYLSSGDSVAAAAKSRNDRYDAAQVKVFSDYVNKKFSTLKMAVVVGSKEELKQENSKTQAMIDNLSFPVKIVELVGSNPPEDFMPNDETYNKLFEENRDIQVFILPNGFNLPNPEDLNRLDIWKDDNKQSLIIVTSSPKDASDSYIDFYMKSKKILAAVFLKSNLTEEDFKRDPKGSDKEIFDMRYILQTVDDAK